MAWRAMHIFYYDNQDDILKSAVRETLDKESVDDFFFIRYWENGPHIRLRLRDVSDAKFQQVKDKIQNYMNQNKSLVELDVEEFRHMSDVLGKREGMTNSDYRLVDNNSVEEWKYEPELVKYSGNAGVAFAEKEFIHSSKLALDVVDIGMKQNLKYFFASCYALDVIKALYSEPQEQKAFIEQYIKYWKGFNGLKNDKAIEAYTLAVKNLPMDRKSIDSIKNFFEAKNNFCFHKNLYLELNKAAENKVIEEDAINRFAVNFIHLFNNRIGITPSEEVLMGILTEKIMEEVYGGE